MPRKDDGCVEVRCKKCGHILATVMRGAEVACHDCKVWTKAK